MNRSMLRHTPFISALFAVARGAVFGGRPADAAAAQQARDEAARVLEAVSRPKGRHGFPTCRYRACLALRRARRKLERQRRHDAQRRLRPAR
ncbi:MAG TPA: hypothetical protein VH253_06320 [Phycisphaerae bacterium]|nr:hypothetical protein [Phycisphaerae bacterium]